MGGERGEEAHSCGGGGGDVACRLRGYDHDAAAGIVRHRNRRAGIGAAAGLAGGLIFDKVKKDEAASYSAGYQAGATGQAPTPPR